ncbi:MAG TPA: hypothetical protein VN644_15805 [Pyrinomonadaceae bacterium]|nr:hypothetical protein [Pyrinomonadaceae bacterium]
MLKQNTIESLGAFIDATTITPKAFANFSPGLERSDNPGITKQNQDQR